MGERDGGWISLIAGRWLVLGLIAAIVVVIALVARDRLGCRSGTFAYTVPIEDPVGQEDWRQDVGILTDAEERIIANDHRAVHVSFGPDADRLVFAKGRGTLSDELVGIFPAGIYVQDVDGSDTELVTKPGGLEPDWSPDGSTIVYVGRGKAIWTVDLESKEPRKVFSLPPSDEVDPDIVFDPKWSPDSDRIAFFLEDQSENTSDIWVMEADGSDPHPVVRAEDARGDLVWSPDGERFAWSGLNEGTTSVFMADADGGEPEAVEPNAEDPVWSRDGSELAYVIGHEGHYEYRIVVGDSDGSDAEAVPMPDDARGGRSLDDWVSC